MEDQAEVRMCTRGCGNPVHRGHCKGSTLKRNKVQPKTAKSAPLDNKLVTVRIPEHMLDSIWAAQTAEKKASVLEHLV